MLSNKCVNRIRDWIECANEFDALGDDVCPILSHITPVYQANRPVKVFPRVGSATEIEIEETNC